MSIPSSGHDRRLVSALEEALGLAFALALEGEDDNEDAVSLLTLTRTRSLTLTLTLTLGFEEKVALRADDASDAPPASRLNKARRPSSMHAAAPKVKCLIVCRIVME